MKVTYIGHSGFMVEGEEVVLLFDYYNGEIPEISTDKAFYVFSSHGHYDHFNPEIFRLLQTTSKVRFILSSDINFDIAHQKKYGISKEDLGKIVRINKNESKVIKIDEVNLEVQTLASTDEGVAFLVSCEGKQIYHAGDLHWWTWIGETEEEYRDMETRFKSEIKRLEDVTIDIAFVPLDPRQEARFFWGMDYFMTHVEARVVFPMHCQEDYSVIATLKNMDVSSSYSEKIMDIRQRGESFTI